MALVLCFSSLKSNYVVFLTLTVDKTWTIYDWLCWRDFPQWPLSITIQHGATRNRNRYNKGNITCYLALLPERNSRSASGSEGGPSHSLPGCPMTIAKRVTLRDSGLIERTKDFWCFANFRSQTCVWHYSSHCLEYRGANYVFFRLNFFPVFNFVCSAIWPVSIY